MRVYIAGPLTASGDSMENIRAALDAAQKVREAGHNPFVPHLNHFWHFLYPASYGEWMAYDLVWLDVCQALIRLPGESPGADIEVRYAKTRRILVYEGVDEFLAARPPSDYLRNDSK